MTDEPVICLADVPPEVWERYERMAKELGDPDDLVPMPRETDGVVDFTGAPHGGRHRWLPEWNDQPRITPTTIIDHSIVGSALGAYYYFRDKTGTESHFIVDLDGEIWQLMLTTRQADANLNANDFAISIETADRGDPNTQPWTSAQLASLKWLHARLRQMHPTIPKQRIPSCSGGGLGYHSQCGTTSSNPWTSAPGKTCPGKPARVEQWNDILLPAFLAGTITPIEEDPMAGLTKADIQDAFTNALVAERSPLATAVSTSVRTELDKVIASPHVFVSNPDRPIWGVYLFSGTALFHVEDPAQFVQVAGEGLSEPNVFQYRNDNPIWTVFPRFSELTEEGATYVP